MMIMTERDMYEMARGSGLLGCNVGTTKWEDAIYKLCRAVAHQTTSINAQNEVDIEMTKHIDRNKVAAHISGMLSELIDQQQPQVDSELALLYSGHRINDGPLIDLYGIAPSPMFDDEDGYLVIDITLHQSKVSLIELFPDSEQNGKFVTNDMIRRLSEWCDQELPSVEQMRAEHNQDAAIDRAESRKQEQI